MLQKRWNILPANQDAVRQLSQALQVNEVICTILTQRGITTFEEAKTYFRPALDMLHSPWLMKDMHKAVNRIEKAITGNEKILVFGDYDVDGTTAVASFYQFLTKIYSPEQTDFYIPNRYTEGYGVSKKGIDFAADNHFSLIVCLDCGIKSVELIEYAATLGIDFIICDHHLPGNELPVAAAILNPKQSDCPYPYKDLCGCGIGFKFMMALAEHFSLEKEEYNCYLDLVATAIAADIVPMTGENRVLAYWGMEQINQHPSPGIKALIELGGLKKSLTISNVVFVIAPRVNAAGRMDDARKAVSLFIEKDYKKALQLAEQLHSDNADRKEADSSITQEALEIIQSSEELLSRKSCVLYRDHWHKGVVGIVASRIIEHHYKPTIVLTKSGDLVTGSARTVKDFNLYEAIYACREHLVAYGGHFAAAGLSMLPEKVNAFIEKFESVVASSIEDSMLIPEIIIDDQVELSAINPAFYKLICQMEPFGPENMRPVFLVRNVMDTGYSKLLKEKHVKFSVRQNNSVLTGIGFNMPDTIHQLQSKKPLDIVFTLDENEYMGNTTIQMKVIDCRFSDINH